jgi:hypothetical protein
VNLGGSSLSVTLGFASAVNNFYIIVDNDGTDAVVNTFNGLPEGGTLTTSNGVVLQISYVGGDGNDVVLRHVNTAPAFADRSVTARVREGGIAILTGTITESDPQDTFFLDVNWGDGTPVETFTFLPGTPRTIQVSHRYLDDGRSGTRSDVARIQLLWRDQNGGSNRDELSTTVVNVPPRLSNVTLRPTSRQRRRARLRGIITDSGRKDTLRVLVRWGDGTTSTQTLRAVRGRLLFSLDHTYRRPGTYRVTLSVRDDDTGSAVLTRVITFNARPTIDVPRRG